MRSVMLLAVLLLSCDPRQAGSETCGDGIVQEGEDCDGADLGHVLIKEPERAVRGPANCEALGLGPGVLRCSGSCSWDPAACGRGR